MTSTKHHSDFDLKALIVSRDAIFRGIIQEVLKSYWTPGSILVEDATQTETISDEVGYGIVLIDEDSIELSKETLKTAFTNHWNSAHIIALTNSVDALSAIKWLKLGARGYAVKTHDKERLQAMVGAVLQGEVVVSKCAMDGVFRPCSKSGVLVLDGLNGVEKLTSTENQVLHSLCKGRTNQEIAQALGCSIGTVKNHIKSLFATYGVGSRLELVVKAATLDQLEHP